MNESASRVIEEGPKRTGFDTDCQINRVRENRPRSPFEVTATRVTATTTKPSFNGHTKLLKQANMRTKRVTKGRY